MNTVRFPKWQQSDAFSLIELLVVIGVMAVLMGAVIVPASGLMQARGVAGAADAASSLITGARIDAMKMGRPVRVVVDANPADREKVFRRMACLRKTADNKWEFSSQVVNLPTGAFFWDEYSAGFASDMKVNFGNRATAQTGSEGGAVRYLEFDGRGQLADQARMVFVSGIMSSAGTLEVPAAREAGRTGFIVRKSGRITHYRSPDEIKK
jgi:prepilin-type N-terminal cleavage/methylation domain-containing protein